MPETVRGLLGGVSRGRSESEGAPYPRNFPSRPSRLPEPGGAVGPARVRELRGRAPRRAGRGEEAGLVSGGEIHLELFRKLLPCAVPWAERFRPVVQSSQPVRLVVA